MIIMSGVLLFIYVFYFSAVLPRGVLVVRMIMLYFSVIFYYTYAPSLKSLSLSLSQILSLSFFFSPVCFVTCSRTD